MHSKKRRLSLSVKLMLDILAVGAILLMVDLSATYYRGSSELQEVSWCSLRRALPRERCWPAPSNYWDTASCSANL